MNCTIQGCPGHYEKRQVLHTVQRGEDILVFENVPVEVCDVCSDRLLAPETIRHLEKLMQRSPPPQRHAPVFAYA
jgi:YgiT-type zinc finger domain-containing protein